MRADIGSATPRIEHDRATEKFRSGIHPERSPEQQLGLLCEGWAPTQIRHPQPRRVRSCPGSKPVLGFDLLKFSFNDAVHLGRFLAEAPEFAKSSHPGALNCPALGYQLVLDCGRDKFTKRHAALSSSRLRSSKDRIRNFQRRLHVETILPYLWDTIKVIEQAFDVHCSIPRADISTGADLPFPPCAP